MLGCSSDAMSVASSGARELVEVREQALDGDRAPVQRALEHHRAARAVAEHRRSDFQAPDARRAANARMRRGSVHARFVVVHAFVFTRARRRLFFRRRKKRRLFPPRERRPRLRGCSLLPPRAPLLLAGENARVLRDGVLDGVLDVFRRHRRAPAPPARRRPSPRPPPDPAAAESATVAAAVKARPRRPSCSSPKSANVSPSVRKLGVYPHSAPSRNGRPRVASAAVASPSGTHAQSSSSVARGDTRDRSPRLAETRAQQSDQPSVLVTLVRSLVRRRFSALAVRREARAGERVQTAGVRADENLRPAAVAHRREITPRAESLKRGKRRRRERPGPSRRLSGTR
jgi:hypothetical protein